MSELTEILDTLEGCRAEIIREAKSCAEEFAKKFGRVTSPEVLSFLKVQPFFQRYGIDDVDPRFMGCVFRDRKKWKRIGYENSGSHHRPVSIWKLVA